MWSTEIFRHKNVVTQTDQFIYLIKAFLKDVIKKLMGGGGESIPQIPPRYIRHCPRTSVLWIRFVRKDKK